VKSILQVWQGGQYEGFIYPGRVFYQNFNDQPVSIISISTFGLTDLYVFLADWNGASEATIRVFINPLTPLVWYGGALMLLGGIVCWWPERRKVRAVRAARQNGMAGAVVQDDKPATAVGKTAKPAGRDDEEEVVA
jgi:cytochrome c-type biogenesis protein CcmF